MGEKYHCFYLFTLALLGLHCCVRAFSSCSKQGLLFVAVHWLLLLASLTVEQRAFHSNPKERQCQRMFKLLYNCTHFTCQQGNVQNPSSLSSEVYDLGTFSCISWIQKRQRNQRSNCKHPFDHRKSKGIPEPTFASLTMLKPLTVCSTTNWKTLKEMGIPDHLTCLLRNLFAGQEATVRTGQETMDQFQIGKGVRQDCMLST